MNLRKILLSAAAAAVLSSSFSFPAHAQAKDSFIDNADLVSSSREDEISEELNTLKEKYDCDVVIYTVQDNSVTNTRKYADDLYSECGFDKDGIMFFVNISTKDWYISTSGSCINAFTDAGIDYMSEQFIPELSDGDYAAAFETYTDLCSDFLKQAETGRPYDSGNLPKEPFKFFKFILIAIIAGLVIALISVGAMMSQLKTVRRKNEASDYKKSGSLRLNENREIFLYKKVDKRRKEQSEGSSTHTSSSGDTRGGSGGSF